MSDDVSKDRENCSNHSMKSNHLFDLYDYSFVNVFLLLCLSASLVFSKIRANQIKKHITTWN